MTASSEPRTSRGSQAYRIALCLSLGWLCIFAWMLLEQGGIHAVVDLQPNEFGDLAAGFAAPMALAWLIAGYFQQQVELIQNTQALLLQARELQDSVVEQRRLASAATAQLELARASMEYDLRTRRLMNQPRLSIARDPKNFRVDSETITVRLMLTNSGVTLREGTIDISPHVDQCRLEGLPPESFTLDEATIPFKIKVPLAFNGALNLQVRYRDINSEKQVQEFEVRFASRHTLSITMRPWIDFYNPFPSSRGEAPSVDQRAAES